MPRHMSFALTADQIRAQAKSVTRRLGWKFLRVGDEIHAVTKTRGLKIREFIWVQRQWPAPGAGSARLHVSSGAAQGGQTERVSNVGTWEVRNYVVIGSSGVGVGDDWIFG